VELLLQNNLTLQAKSLPCTSSTLSKLFRGLEEFREQTLNLGVDQSVAKIPGVSSTTIILGEVVYVLNMPRGFMSSSASSHHLPW